MVEVVRSAALAAGIRPAPRRPGAASPPAQAGRRRADRPQSNVRVPSFCMTSKTRYPQTDRRGCAVECAGEISWKVSRMDPEQLAAAVAVADESLAAQTADYGLQAAIAQHRPDLWAALASNPTTYPSLLEWLSGIQEPAVRLALEARGIAPQTEAVPQAGEGVPGDARPEGPVEPPADEAEAAESSAGEDVSEVDASDEPVDAPADEAEPEAAAESPDSPSGEAEAAAGSSADEAAPEEEAGEPPAEGASAGADEDVPEADASDEPADAPADEAEPADSRADGGAPTEMIETGTDEAEPEADASDEPAESSADENEPAESLADEADSEVAADVSAGDSAPEGEPVEPPAEEAADSRTRLSLRRTHRTSPLSRRLM